MKPGVAKALLAAALAALASASCRSREPAQEGSTSLATTSTFQARVPLRPGSAEPAVISLHRLDSRRIQGSGELGELGPLLVAAWPDGTICWSRNQARGGTPYLSARLDPVRLSEHLERLRPKLEPEPARGRTYGVPDASSLTLALLVDGRVLGLSSCIPCFEDDPRLVATDTGIEALEGRDRVTVITAQSPALLEFRRTWSQAVSMVWSMVPPDGEPLAVDHFEYAWRP